MRVYIANGIPVDIHPEQKTKQEIIQEYVTESKREHKDDRFIVCDIGDIIEKYQQWMRLFPRVKLFYAVKCNSDKGLLQLLLDLGASFDCASSYEIEKVLDLGVSPDRVIYTHTQKPISSLIYAERHNVSLLAFDCELELHKIKSYHPKARLVLRISIQVKFDSIEPVDDKFGCTFTETRDLLQLAKDLELCVVGVSFHVGSAIKNPISYRAALKQSKAVFEIGRDIGFRMDILDIGGGFPGSPETSDLFQKIVNVVNETLGDLFSPEEGVDIIAEPGRYVVSSAYTVVVNITGKRRFPKQSLIAEKGSTLERGVCEDDSNSVMYYVNGSAFGNFSIGRMVKPGYITYIPKPVKSVDDTTSHKSIVWGFASTAHDCINPEALLPELEIGDWLYFEDMGAYTQSISTHFNGLRTPEIKYFCSEDVWIKIYPEQRKEGEK